MGKHAVFGFGILMLVASLIPACGGGGGGSAGAAPAAPQASTAEFSVHESTVTPLIANITPTNTWVLLRSFMYYPASNSRILKIELTGEVSLAGSASLNLALLNATGTFSYGNAVLPEVGSNGTFNGFTLALDHTYQAFLVTEYPVAQYNIRFSIRNVGPTGNAQVRNFKLRIFTAEGIVTIPASPQISG